MENFFSRYKNPLALMAVLFIQVVALATQVKRPENAKVGTTGNGTRLIRVWTLTAFTPVEKMFVSTGHFFSSGWHNYADLRGVRRQNQDLQDEVSRLQMEQVQLRQDADQARRLQALLEFKEKYVSKTVAAQVIGTSGTEQSRVIIIDKGSRDGIKPDMAVITPEGIVGKVKDVFPLSSQVLLINDHDSGAGVILEQSRLQGIVKGTSLGELQINDVMSDEKVETGEHLITSGGDRIYPKGFSVGTVISATPDRDNDPFLVIKVRPSADLRRLEEVLVITKMAEEAPSVAGSQTPMRAADILAQRLPSIPKPDPNAAKKPGGTSTGPLAPGKQAAKPSPTPAKESTTGNNTEQKPGNLTGPTKQAAGNTGGPTPAPAAGKAGIEAKKPASAAQTATSVGANGTTTSALPKPSPTPKKQKTAAPGSVSPATSEPKPTNQPGTAIPVATPTPTPEMHLR
ncbi:MAG TPA: rod shape-determining protein MreC [Candidatus Angelobacter sp.]|jgi:rod shape-determining protein MreC